MHGLRSFEFFFLLVFLQCSSARATGIRGLRALVSGTVTKSFKGARTIQGKKWMFMSHFKGGSSLLKRVAGYTAHFLGSGWGSDGCEYGSDLDMWRGCPNISSFRCMQNPVLAYWHATPQLVVKLQAQCPEFLAVHLIRDPKALVVSAYIWISTHPRLSYASMGLNQTEVATVPTKEGFLLVAAAFMKTLEQMYGLYLVSEGDERFLRSRLEDASHDFKTWFYDMMIHLTKSMKPEVVAEVVPTLFKTLGKVEHPDYGGPKLKHTSSKEDKERVIRVYEELLNENHHLMRQIEFYRAGIGYI